MTEAVIDDVQEKGIAQGVVLSWPEVILAENKPNFETLLSKRDGGPVSAILILKLEELSFLIIEKKLSVVGWTKIVRAEIKIKGALIYRPKLLFLLWRLKEALPAAIIKAQDPMKSGMYLLIFQRLKNRSLERPLRRPGLIS